MTATPQEIAGNLSVVLSIDPGRAKCGIAVVSGPSPIDCRHKAVVESLRLTVEVAGIVARFPGVQTVVIGGGTGCSTLRRALRAEFPGLTMVTIDEHRSSERARARFLQESRPSGWRRLIPKGLRTPDRPYDDIVALILAEDYFKSQQPTG